MTDKKQLNDEELDNVNGGCGDLEWQGHKEIEINKLQINQRVKIGYETDEETFHTYGPGKVSGFNIEKREVIIFDEFLLVNRTFELGKYGHIFEWEND